MRWDTDPIGCGLHFQLVQRAAFCGDQLVQLADTFGALVYVAAWDALSCEIVAYGCVSNALDSNGRIIQIIAAAKRNIDASTLPGCGAGRARGLWRREQPAVG